MTPLYTVADASRMLGSATSTIRKHAHRLGIVKRGRDYLFGNLDIARLRNSLAASKPGRPAKR